MMPSGNTNTVTQYAPNGQSYVEWFERIDEESNWQIQFKTTTRTQPIFTRNTVHRQSLATWDPTSTYCLLSDAPDNGNIYFWLFTYDTASKQWQQTSLDLLSSLAAEHSKLDPETRHLLRLGLLKIRWVSPTVVQIWVTTNEGTFLLRLDATSPDHIPTVEKLSQAQLDIK